jgi:hypothetical protein
MCPPRRGPACVFAGREGGPRVGPPSQVRGGIAWMLERSAILPPKGAVDGGHTNHVL